MTHEHSFELKTISEDYPITMESLRSDVKLPFILTRLLFMLLAIAANIGLVYLLLATRYDLLGVIEYEIAASITAGLTIFVMGVIGGRVWISVGYRLSRATYNVYLDKDKGIFQKLFGYLYLRFTEPDNRIYLEARAKDPRLNNPFNLLSLVVNISISQLSFFMVGSVFLARPFVEYLRGQLPEENVLIVSETNQLIVQNIAAMGVAVIIMGLYIPMNYIMTDSNIRTWSLKEMKIGTPSQKVRSRIDNLIGIGAVLTGWGIYQEETRGGTNRFLLDEINWIVEGYDFAIVMDYILWLGTLLVLAWPLIVPASIYYFSNHAKTVNKFRAEASFRGVPTGVSLVRFPLGNEYETINKFQASYFDPMNKDNRPSEDSDEPTMN